MGHGGVYAIDKQTGQRVVSGFSGLNTQFYTNLNLSFVLEEPFLDGHYVLPVPKGDYIMGIEPVDDRPLRSGLIDEPTVFGAAMDREVGSEAHNGTLQ